MGRLTYEYSIFSFAQFERELACERFRDKFLASRKRGLWMGGHAPLGFDVRDRKLVVNEAEAPLARDIFAAVPAGRIGHETGPGAERRRAPHQERQALRQGRLYKLLNNRTYVGEVEHRGVAYRGEQEAHHRPRHLAQGARHSCRELPAPRQPYARRHPGPAQGADCRSRLQGYAAEPHPKPGKLYRFYRTATSLKLGHGACPIRAVPAGEVEAAVIGQIRALLRTPEMVARIWRAAWLDDRAGRRGRSGRGPAATRSALGPALPAEQARILQLLVARVMVRIDGLEIGLRVDGMASVVGGSFRCAGSPERRAA